MLVRLRVLLDPAVGFGRPSPILFVVVGVPAGVRPRRRELRLRRVLCSPVGRDLDPVAPTALADAFGDALMMPHGGGGDLG